MNRLIIMSAVCLTAVQGAIATHEIAVEGPLLHAEEGLIIGNGDLSCSVFQEGDETVFRLGKGDVWDRRVDYSTSPKPPTHDEFVRGLLDDGWRATGYFGKSDCDQKSGARKGASDRGRSHHIGFPLSMSETDRRAAFAFPFGCGAPGGHPSASSHRGEPLSA